MPIEVLRHVLLWCLVANYSILFLWFLVFAFARDTLFKLHSRWFSLPGDVFDGIHYGGMAVYKIGILLLNLVPFAALSFLTPGS